MRDEFLLLPFLAKDDWNISREFSSRFSFIDTKYVDLMRGTVLYPDDITSHLFLWYHFTSQVIPGLIATEHNKVILLPSFTLTTP